MDGFRIRRYRDEDDEAVKEIFTLGMSEHVPAAFMHMLKQPLIQMVLLCVFCFLLASSKSLLLSVLALTLMMAGLRQLASSFFRSYTQMCLKEDLACIRETYMEKTDSCFWVVENKGQLVATVACLPWQSQPELLELKRMSVRRSYRGLGIGKALCRTVADFTRERGRSAVLLHTTLIQTDAQKLYEHMGFTKMREIPYPNVVGKLTNLYLLEYRLELQEGKVG
ncbi:hypothetical protein GJAV_G00063450 [Gymnothorax javanicus]|nr:hypothetical protein GJAV_G00063450 [Gymnothorax javanicus]